MGGVAHCNARASTQWCWFTKTGVHKIRCRSAQKPIHPFLANAYLNELQPEADLWGFTKSGECTIGFQLQLAQPSADEKNEVDWSPCRSAPDPAPSRLSKTPTMSAILYQLTRMGIANNTFLCQASWMPKKAYRYGATTWSNFLFQNCSPWSPLTA